MIREFIANLDTTASEAEQGGHVRQVNPATMTHADRQALISAIDAGYVFALRFRVRAFGSAPNLNGPTLAPHQIDELATTAQGTDLMLDHSDSAARTVGETLSAEARTEGQERVLILEHELTDPDAMRRFVRRQLRRFSVAISASDWLPDSGGNYQAVSPVRLVHNAFVSDPAYQRAAVIDNQTQAKRPTMDTQQGALDQSARIAELEQLLGAAEQKSKDLAAALDALEAKAFGVELDRAESQGRIKPASRAKFEASRKALGFDAAAELLAGIAEGAALPVRAVGDAPAAVAAPVAAPKQMSVDDRVKAIVGDKYNPKARRV